MRTSTLFNALSGAAVVAAGVLAMDLGDEMRMGWKYGLLPRQTTQNLQTFDGNLGGVQASAVCDYISIFQDFLPLNTRARVEIFKGGANA